MRIALPEHKKLVHELSLPIRWGDMDAMGHVNNASYFRYMETIRIEWLRLAGALESRSDEGVVIVNAFCNFHQQFEYPDDVLMKLYVSDPARATFETWVTMERVAQPGVLHATGGATAAWIDYAAKKARSLPDWLRTLVQ